MSVNDTDGNSVDAQTLSHIQNKPPALRLQNTPSCKNIFNIDILNDILKLVILV